MLRIQGLNEGLLQRILCDLREVCGERATLPDSHIIPRQFSGWTVEPRVTSKYAKVWRDKVSLGEEGNRTTDVCVKAIKTEKLYKVGEPSSALR